MGGGGGGEEAQLKGLSKYFNAVTVNGRANVAKLTYAVCAGFGIWLWSRPKKPGAPKKGSKNEPKIPAGNYNPDGCNCK